ncbi:MAG TPA: EAL domain-containing protein [Allosphingosinicella sp.]|jgi:diguanylate cyclase (GGDEF)-like protein
MRGNTEVLQAPNRTPSRASLKSSLRLSTAITLVSTAMFAALASAALLEDGQAALEGGLGTAVVLNAALLLFGWRRSKALSDSVAACADAEQRAFESAFCDHVTGLANRRQLVQRIEAASQAGDQDATLLLLDLDHFKRVNDSYGHAGGDTLLQHVAATLTRLAPAEACCARLGGDEFAMLLGGERDPGEVSVLAQALLSALSEPVDLDHGKAQVSASIGIATLWGEAPTAEALLKRSDIAMYEAKRLGRNGFVWFDREMERQLHSRITLESEMRAGIAAGEFVPYYQPQFGLSDGGLKGFEVLARWHHPTRGVLEPLEFIAVAEATGFISDLSMSVMRRALLEAKGWPSNLTIAINVSPVQFRDPLLGQRILRVVTESGFPPARLEIEITESALLEDQDQALATVESLKNVGVSISLDDFGTGYASLTQLQSLPFDRIKIDKSFVAALLSDQQSSAIVSTIANLGRSLHLPVTAEGVETEEVRARLQSLGCADGQGWLWGKAVPAEAVHTLLAGRAAIALPEVLQALVPVAGGDRRDAERRPTKRKPRAA